MPAVILKGFIAKISNRNTIVFMNRDEFERMIDEISKFKQKIIVIHDPNQDAYYVSALRVVVYINRNEAKREYLKELAQIKRATVVQ